VDAGSKYLAAFIVSMVLQGFGAVPLYVLGVTYLDDASAHGTASVHIGNDVRPRHAFLIHTTIVC